MSDNYEDLRGERRSFHCPNKLWKELNKKCGEVMPASTYIRLAILEKLIRDEPEKEEYFRDLIMP
ncbi:hypothetical protein K9M79_01610 [Candidatus Woesearchaeota archaeon]|nr:hypothetical protein [Candidatus Woesearchaeota archaeon]